MLGLFEDAGVKGAKELAGTAAAVAGGFTFLYQVNSLLETHQDLKCKRKEMESDLNLLKTETEAKKIKVNKEKKKADLFEVQD